jgi:hypothetical protein
VEEKGLKHGDMIFLTLNEEKQEIYPSLKSNNVVSTATKNETSSFRGVRNSYGWVVQPPTIDSVTFAKHNLPTTFDIFSVCWISLNSKVPDISKTMSTTSNKRKFGDGDIDENRSGKWMIFSMNTKLVDKIFITLAEGLDNGALLRILNIFTVCFTLTIHLDIYEYHTHVHYCMDDFTCALNHMTFSFSSTVFYRSFAILLQSFSFQSINGVCFHDIRQ